MCDQNCRFKRVLILMVFDFFEVPVNGMMMLDSPRNDHFLVMAHRLIPPSWSFHALAFASSTSPKSHILVRKCEKGYCQQYPPGWNLLQSHYALSKLSSYEWNEPSWRTAWGQRVIVPPPQPTTSNHHRSFSKSSPALRATIDFNPNLSGLASLMEPAAIFQTKVFRGKTMVVNKWWIVEADDESRFPLLFSRSFPFSIWQKRLGEQRRNARNKHPARKRSCMLLHFVLEKRDRILVMVFVLNLHSENSWTGILQ